MDRDDTLIWETVVRNKDYRVIKVRYKGPDGLEYTLKLGDIVIIQNNPDVNFLVLDWMLGKIVTITGFYVAANYYMATVKEFPNVGFSVDSMIPFKHFDNLSPEERQNSINLLDI